MFIVGFGLRRRRISPRAVSADERFSRGGSPGPGFVFLHRGRVLHDRLDDPPLRIDDVFASKQLIVSPHRVAKQALIGRALRAERSHQQKFDLSPIIRSPGGFTRTPIATITSGLIRAAYSPPRVHRLAECLARRRLEFDRDLGGCHRQAFAGADVDRHARPAPAVHEQLHRDKCFDRRTRRTP